MSKGSYDYTTVPSIDMDYIQSVTGIDLTKPLTEETAKQLNYAFLNNDSFPEGTMISVTWNDSTKSCDLHVMCTTGFSVDTSSTDYGYNWGYNPSHLEGLLQGDKIIDKYTEVTRLEPKSSLPNPMYHNFKLQETHTFSIPGGVPMSDAFTNLDNQIQKETWDYIKVATTKPRGIVSQQSYSSLFTEQMGHEPSDYEYMYEDATGGYFRHDGELINDDSETVYGFSTPERNLELVRLKNCDDIKSNVVKMLYGDAKGVSVNFVDGKYVVNIYGAEIYYDETECQDFTKITKDVSQRVQLKLEDNSDHEYDFIRTQQYINSQIKDKDRLSSGDLYFLGSTQRSGQDDTYSLTSKKYTLNLTEYEMQHPDESDTIKNVINAANLQNDFASEGHEATIMVHDKHNQTIYECIINGEKKQFLLENGKYYEVDSAGKKVDDKEYSDIKSYYTGDNAPKKYYRNNDRLSLNQNSGICDADEVRYNEIVSNLNGIDVKSSVSPGEVSSAYSKVNKYITDSSGSINATISKIDNNINMLSKLIDAIVNLYILHDAELKEIFDGLITGSDNSLADQLFAKFKSKGDQEITIDDFKKDFVNYYKSFVKEVSEELLIYKNMQEKGLVLDVTDPNSEEYKYLQKRMEEKGLDISKVLEKKDGHTFISLENYEKIFGDDIQLLELNKGDELSSKYLGNDNLFNTILIGPMSKYSNLVNNYENIAVSIKNYNNMTAMKDYVEYLFDPKFMTELQYVRNNGKTDEGYTDDWMTPAELAMWSYLKKNQDGLLGGVLIDSKSQGFKKAIGPMMNERKGRYDAAQYVLNMIENGIDGWDVVTRGLWGFKDGFLSTVNNMYHCFDHNNQNFEWTSYYITKYIADSYDLSTVQQKYTDGKISNKEYEMMKKLTGSVEIADSYKITSEQKNWLNNAYNFGNTVGDTTFQLALLALTQGTGSAVTAGTAAARVATITKIVRYGTVFASTFGGNMNKNWDSILHDVPGEYWTLFGRSAGKAGIKTGMLALTDMAKGKISSRFKKSSDASLDALPQNTGTSSAFNTKFLEAVKKTDYLAKIREQIPGGTIYNAIKNKNGPVAGWLTLLAVSGNKVVPTFFDSGIDGNWGKGLSKSWTKLADYLSGNTYSFIGGNDFSLEGFVDWGANAFYNSTLGGINSKEQSITLGWK